MAMDTWGRVWHGSVGSEFTLADSAYPYGIRTDYARLGREIQQAEEPFVVVDLGSFPLRAVPEPIASEQELGCESAWFEAYGLVQGSWQGALDSGHDGKCHPSQTLLNRGYSLTPVLCWD